MNSIVYNPNLSHRVAEWTHIYLSEPEIEGFEKIIGTTCDYLEVIVSNKIKRGKSLNEQLISEIFSPDRKEDFSGTPEKKKILHRKGTINEEGRIEYYIDEVNRLRG